MEDDRTFYERRMREELARAGTEPDTCLRLLHLRWAQLYLARLERAQPDVDVDALRGRQLKIRRG